MDKIRTAYLKRLEIDVRIIAGPQEGRLAPSRTIGPIYWVEYDKDHCGLVEEAELQFPPYLEYWINEYGGGTRANHATRRSARQGASTALDDVNPYRGTIHWVQQEQEGDWHATYINLQKEHGGDYD